MTERTSDADDHADYTGDHRDETGDRRDERADGDLTGKPTPDVAEPAQEPPD